MIDKNEFTGIINVSDEMNSYNLKFGFSKNNSFDFRNKTDKYAPPAPPPFFFDTALSIKGERYYSKILSPDSYTYNIILQYGQNNKIILNWKNKDWSKYLHQCNLKGFLDEELLINIDMLKENELIITNSEIISLKLNFIKL